MNSMQIEAKMICPWSGHSASLLKHNAWDLGFFVINTGFVPLNYFSFLKKNLLYSTIFFKARLLKALEVFQICGMTSTQSLFLTFSNQVAPGLEV